MESIKALRDLQKLQAEELRAAETLAYEQFRTKLLDRKDSLLNSLESLLYENGEPCYSECGDVERMLRIDLSDYIDSSDEIEIKMFERLLSEDYCLHLKDDVLSLFMGPCIIINNDGDVLDQDSGKWFIDSGDYSDKNELRELIEKHMELTGYYPDVLIEVDRYGTLKQFKMGE